MSISGGAIDPPPWWVAKLSARVKVGPGRNAVPAGMLRQADLIALLLRKYDREYSAPEVSRACNGKRIPVQLAIDLSELVEIPAPVYVVRTEEEAGRIEAQRAVTRTIAAATAPTPRPPADLPARAAKERLLGQLADMKAGVASATKARQSGVVRPMREESSGSRRGESK